MAADTGAEATKQAREEASSNWKGILEAVNRPISFYALAILAFTVAIPWGGDVVKVTLVSVLAILVGVVTFLTVKHPDKLLNPADSRRPSHPAPGDGEPGTDEDGVGRLSSVDTDSALADADEPPSEAPSGILERVRRLDLDIYGARSRPPDLDKWYNCLRPTLHQAPFYTTPTYFLDSDLYILDYNLAFELIFRKAAGYLRGRHVNWFIAQLQNHGQVHEHGRAFTQKVEREKCFPLVDLEPIVYDSPDFGRVEFIKIASQLHDTDGALQGWAVALMVKGIAWDKFEPELAERLRQDKLWSVYSASYDRILTTFPSYQRLIDDVAAALPDSNMLVADLGAGTGNVTRALLEKGHRVVAIENNIGMLDRFRKKDLSAGPVTLIKDSIENCERLREGVFDAAVMVNVLYAVDDPLWCLKQVNRILKPGGYLGFSTTHRETRLDELLEAIKAHLEATSKDERWPADYQSLYKVNREIERSIARRYTSEKYLEYVRAAGFEVVNYVPSTYHNAVMLVHARKKLAR